MRKNRTRVMSLLVAAAGSVAAGVSTTAQAQNTLPGGVFTPGDVVVLRGGDSAIPDTVTSTNEVPVFLDEYSPATGQLVGSLGVDSSGDSSTLTLPSYGGNWQHEGNLELSGDGNSLTFAGYALAASNANNSSADEMTAANESALGKNIGVVNLAANLNTSIGVQSFGVTANSANPWIRGAYTQSGTLFYAFGKYNTGSSTSNGGLALVNTSTGTPTTTTVEGWADWRSIYVYNGQLYGGTGSSSAEGGASDGNQGHGVFAIGTGVQSANVGAPSGTTNVPLNSDKNAASDFAFLHVPETGAGYSTDPTTGANVLYTVGNDASNNPGTNSTPGISKYFYNGSGWVLASQTEVLGLGSSGNPVGLIALADPNNPDATDLLVSGNSGLYSYIDSTSPSTAMPAADFYNLVNAPTNEQFYGAAVVPTTGSISVLVPEPTSLALLGLGALGLLGRRNRRSV